VYLISERRQTRCMSSVIISAKGARKILSLVTVECVVAGRRDA
jgi:hypothetical protein